MEESTLKDLKESYLKIKEKYGLPDFDELNKDFQIEKIAGEETDFLIREVRKFVSEKISNYVRFVETILNPVSVPMFVFSFIKAIGIDEKKKLEKVYKSLAKIEVDLIELDIEFSEQKEANFIKNSYLVWQSIKKDILDVVEVVKKNWDNKAEKNGSRYFG